MTLVFLVVSRRPYSDNNFRFSGKIATDLCGGRMKAIREALDDKSPFNEIKESRKSERIEDHDKSPSDDVAEDVAEEVKGTSACQNKV